MRTICADSKKSKVLSAVLLAVMIIVQLGIITYYMAEKKMGYHMDELWSYGLSNSYYQPHLYTRFGIDEWNEYNEWQDADFFKEYLTVGEDERFEYGSVYYNQKYDVHPPLYYYVLHTVCSFFPDSFSPWYAFAINAVSFVVVQIFLYLCVLKISRSRFLALAVCALWGFSSGAITCFIYLRMYAMLMAFTVIYTYLTLKLIYDGFTQKRLAALCVVTYLGSLVQYFFIIFAGAMAACMCVYYLAKKQPKRMFAYGGFLLLSVGLAVLSFVPMISHMLDKNEVMGLHATYTKHKTFALQLHFILRYMLDDISGIDIHLINTPIMNYILCVLVALAAIGLPLCFLFRNEVWFKALLSKLKTGIKSNVGSVRSKIGLSVAALLIISVAVFAIFAINGLVSPIAYMKQTSSHYSVQVYPLFIAVVMCFVYMFLRLLPKVGIRLCAPVAFVMCVSCILGSRLGCDVGYLFDENLRVESALKSEMCELTRGGDCIVVVKGESDIQFYPWDLFYADSVYVSPIENFESSVADWDAAGSGESEVYLIILQEALVDYEFKDETDEIFVELLKGDEEDAEKIQDKIDVVDENSVLAFVKEKTRFENIEYVGYRVIQQRVNHIYKLS